MSNDIEAAENMLSNAKFAPLTDFQLCQWYRKGWYDHCNATISFPINDEAIKAYMQGSKDCNEIDNEDEPPRLTMTDEEILKRIKLWKK